MKLKLDIVKNRFIFLALSACLLTPGIIAMIYSSITYPTHAPLKVGIDYTGGTTIQYGVKEDITNEKLSAIRTNLEKNGIDNPYLQIIHVNDQQDSNLKSILSVRTKFIDEGSADQDKITAVVNKDFADSELVSVTSVGPTLGKELFKNSLIALSLALLGIIAYLTFQFQFNYALAAILGLVHDSLFVIGVFSILGLFFNVQVDALFVTAVLTVIGASVHDTIVVFDRVRENLKYYGKKMSFSEIMNASINQTLTRSIYTSLTTFIMVLVLFIMGVPALKEFTFTLMAGIVCGAYSSICITGPMWYFFKKHIGKKKEETA